uniref:Large ribosomal subunit protein uL24 C-terminal domain-containing protein n=1 Tax=Phaeomonas parva TaxID=124430 RepID=A0A7S1UIX0_9STRA|mmetsp:Transcript_6151/g.17169  ORF Transcript_6151/g.17169 Transcript_6151/m.17169 type:complete len:196 (+) Transcript_6151:85-672(+)|eukprot:CAMPEP_0118880140 /NCGR_PEP_ID=MMETSP1163-20130328/19744_1 /TAXON_ID=124430 /ORGANISM="Phaeomonas parva, Strain CCMP2877" /LENGTH=195 /DNA_ID=CAMNT_0006816445 /DNA_START=104 /DNA_END=691 /DNA_ORIENTATION=+
MYRQPRALLRALLIKPRGRPDRRGQLGRWAIKKGDTVEVVDGPNDRGKRGKVLAVLKPRERVVVDGINVRKSYVPPEDPASRGSFIQKPWSIHYSNVQVVCPETDQPTKIGYRKRADGKFERFARISGAALPIPPEHLEKEAVDYRVGPLDTPAEEVHRTTFQGFDEQGREIGLKDWGEKKYASKAHMQAAAGAR